MSQLFPRLASMHRGPSASHPFWSELAAHFAHRVFIYTAYGAELFSVELQQLCSVGQLFGVMPPLGLRPADELWHRIAGATPFLALL